MATTPWIIRLVRALAIAGLALVALLVLAGSYLQSASGFQRVVLPFARDALGVDVLTVRQGWLSLRGSIEVEGLDVQDADRGIRFQTWRGRASVSLASLWEGGRILLEEVELEQPTLTLGPRRRDETPGEPSAPFHPRDLAKLLTPLRLPIDIQRGVARDFEILFNERTRRMAAIGPGHLEVDDLLPGQAPHLFASTLVLLAPEEEDRRYAGSIDVSLDLASDWQGGIHQLSGRAEIELMTPDLRGDRPIKGEMEATLDVRDSEQTSGRLAMTMTRMDRSLGNVTLAIDRTGANHETLEGVLKVQTIDAEAINPLLAFFGVAQLASATADGQASVSAGLDDDEIAVAIELGAQNVVRALDDGHLPEPIALHSALRGAWVPRTGAIDLAQVDVGIVRDEVERLSISLPKPHRLELNSDPSRESKLDLPASFMIVADRFSIEDLRRLIAGLGLRTWNRVLAGEMTGRIRADLQHAGRALALAGEMHFTSARLLPDVFEAWPPVNVVAAINARVVDFKNVRFDDTKLKFDYAGETLTTGTLSGTGGEGAMELYGTASLRDLPRTLSRLSLELPGLRLAAGTASGEYAVRLEPDWVAAEMTLDAEGLVVGSNTRARLPLPPTKASAKMRWPRHTKGFHLEDLVLRVAAPEGGEEQIAHANGFLGGFALERDQLHAHFERFALAPWARFAGLPVPPIGALPLNGAIEYSSARDSDEAQLAAQGEVEVAPIGGTDSTVPVKLAVDVEINRGPDAAMAMRAALGSDEDRAEIDATFHDEATPQLVLRVRAAHIDLERYLLLTLLAETDEMLASDAEADATDASPTPATATSPEPAVVTRPLTAKAEVTIRELRYRALRLEQAKIEGSVDEQGTKIDLGSGTLAGGRVVAKLQRRAAEGRERMRLQIRTQGVDVQPIYDSFGADDGRQFRGRLDLTSELESWRLLDQPLLETVRGDVAFQVREGRIESNRRLTSHLAEFLQLRDLQDLVFSQAEGKLHIEDERLDIDDTLLEGRIGTIDINGTISFGGDVVAIGVLRANPGVGALSALGLGRETVVGKIVGISTVPVEITMTGPISDVSYQSRLLAPEVLQGVRDVFGIQPTTPKP